MDKAQSLERDDMGQYVNLNSVEFSVASNKICGSSATK